jgi:multidrug efflux pump
VISRFFIDRPVFASVISIVITLAGAVSLGTLPLAMFPHVAPPSVSVMCKYPGASARDVASAVAAPIEQEVNGVEGMLYMSSQCTNDGSYNLSVTFQHGMDLNMAQVLVQNRIALAMPRLPDVIKQAGVTSRKQSPDILLSIALNSPSGKYDQLYLNNYATLHMQEELARMPGVSEVRSFGGQDYSMRVWVDPEKLAHRDLTAGDVVAAIREQNRPAPVGQIGQPPNLTGQAYQKTLTTKGRLTLAEEFEDLVIKRGPNGALVRLKDVGRAELAAKSLDASTRVNGLPSASLAIFLLPDANALETADLVKAKVAQLAEDFPEGMQYEIRYDTTPFIRESINEVYKTLREAIVLVAVVVLLFLQNWRSAIIPLIAVPVGIIGTFAVMSVMGFSINNLTLFGLVLAIGIVVDDAIVVVEAVEHHMEHGLPPREATIVAMEEVSGPVIAIGLVLTAVFVPCAFISGIVGQFFRQFALTIAASTVISTINSLTLSPALAALLLKPKPQGPTRRRPAVLPPLMLALICGWAAHALLTPKLAAALAGLPAAAPRPPSWAPEALAAAIGALGGWAFSRPINWALATFFALFNAAFRISTGLYARGVGVALRISIGVLAAYGGLLYITYYGVEFKLPKPLPPADVYFAGFAGTPKGFIPSQDMGYLLASVQLPDAASYERTDAVMDKLVKIAGAEKGVRFTVSVTGNSLLLGATGSNFGSMFIILDEFSERESPDLYYEAILGRLRGKIAKQVPEANVVLLGPPPVRGVGRAGGFKLMVEDLADNELATLQGQTDNLSEQAGQDVRLANLSTVFRANVPQLFADVDRAEVMSKRVALRDLFGALQIYLGSLYVNDINLFGRTWQVIVQAEPTFRRDPASIKRLKVRNAAGRMVPIGALAEIQERNGPLVLTRYNMRTAAPINGSAAPGVSSGDAIALMEELARRELPSSMTYEWTELAYLELQAGNTAMILFALAVVMVFLVLAAQYESWALPLAVILVVPMCLLCAIAGVNMAKQDINIFTQVGFVVLVGLACKNAILIVEFARAQRRTGLSRREAALSACRLRLRPIVMTSLAFILGVVPLLVSKGAGAEMRRTLGTTVFSGMLGVTIFGLVLTPVFFVMVDWLGSTPIFRSRLARRVNAVLKGVLALGYARQAARFTYRVTAERLRARAGRRRPALPDGRPSGNGHAHPPAPASHALEPAASGHGPNGHAHGAGNGHGNGNGHDHATPSTAAAGESNQPADIA